jgi:hypothetical protein
MRSRLGRRHVKTQHALQQLNTYLFPSISKLFKTRTYHKIIPENPTAMLIEKPTLLLADALDP